MPNRFNPLITSPRLARFLFWSYLAVLSYLLLLPEPLWFLSDGSDTHQRIDQGLHPFLQHMATFTLLGVVWVHYRKVGKQRSGLSVNWLAGLALYCTGIEVAQYWIPERFFEGLDMLANLMGATLGILIAQWIHRRLIPSLTTVASYQPVAVTSSHSVDG